MQHPDSIHKLTRLVFIATSALVIIAGTIWGIRLFSMLRSHTTIQPQPTVLAIGGMPMAGKPAPDFNLTDQFSHPVSLSSLHGHEVVLAFIDARCKSICPLTAQIMYNAKTHLGASAASQIELVAINANPTATSVAAVQSWSIQHGMLHQWSFLTGTAQQLQSVYHAYGIYDKVDASGEAVHDPVMLIIDAKGHEQLYFETFNSNASADLSSEELGLEAGMRQWLPQP
jgi:protein SCO1/2